METPLINDLNICVATENGSGSASSNNILFKELSVLYNAYCEDRVCVLPALKMRSPVTRLPCQ